jgi:hypothetical protein
MIENKIKELIRNLSQFLQLTSPELITRDLEKSLIEVTKWLARLYIFESERRMNK